MATVGAPRRSSTIVAWLLYLPQLLIDLTLAAFGITSVFMTDSCGSTGPQAAVCDVGYFSVVLLGFWASLLALVVLVPVAIVVSGRRGGRPWQWPLLGILASAALVVIFVALMTR